ncbi:rhomboid-domain-containing protein [Schizopora paradoxa]|uniref:Rhomboid-type serine protease n=1 Tax=Schizopora paradoxa TaxID=27342 RepID=A0A0H2RYE6_9AGAM|nr:rhomboid-domain-containing protein [Schizopora paradoxa]
MTYIDEDFNYYSSRKPSETDDKHESSLIGNAAGMGRSDEYQDPLSKHEFGDEPAEQKNGLARFFANGKYPLEQRIENKKRGIGRQKYPFVVWLLTTIMVAVFIYELVVNGRQQGTPISFKPTVNPMLGPSESALINVGARFPPCMKTVDQVPVTLLLPCMNDTANPPDRTCPISDLCGFGGIADGETPNQWFRFITAIFLHAGIIHIVLNMLAQCIVSAQIEREMGSGGFFIVYFAAGIFGNVLGGNFALVGVPSVGASGAIFGTVAVTWVDLLTHWRYHYKPKTRLVYMTVELIVGIALGFVPYVDNFAHLGGFLMGLLVGTIFYPVICTSRRQRLLMYGIRLAMVPIVIVLYVLLVRNFYTSDPYAACSGCRYLSCIPTNANNHCKG